MNSPVTTPSQKVSLEEEPVQAPKPLQQNTGALEDGKWETIYQKEGISLYKVQYKGKNITVIGDWHTKAGKIVLSKVLEEVKMNPRTWKLLIEGLDYIPEITREIKDSVGKAVSLPHAGDGIKFLIDSKQVTAKDMALAYAMARLDRIGRELNTTQEERDNPLEQVSSEISNNLKALHEIILGKEEQAEYMKRKLAFIVKQCEEIVEQLKDESLLVKKKS